MSFNYSGTKCPKCDKVGFEMGDWSKQEFDLKTKSSIRDNLTSFFQKLF